MKKFFGILIVITAVVFFIWFSMAAVIYRVINIGNIIGILICICLIFRFGFKNAYNKLKERFYSKKVSRIIYKIIIACWAVFGVYAVFISSLMIYSSLSYPPDDKNEITIIVLGAQVKPWGPSTMLQQRIDAAEQFLNNNNNSKAVLSGGKGNDEPVSEAQSMYDNINIKDKNRLFLENQSKNTQQNLAYSKKIIEKNSLSPRIALVTDSYHQLRAALIAHKEAYKDTDGIYAVNTKNSTTGLILYPTFFVREWLAIPVEFFK